MQFNELALAEPLKRALADLNFSEPTPTQEACLPALLEGRDVLVQAKTGSGKTLAFGLPIAQSLIEQNHDQGVAGFALVLCPTRELAQQVSQQLRTLFRYYPNTKISTFVGGVAIGPQIASLVHTPNIIVGTPGRILDLVRKKHLQLNTIKALVLDEADRMLDMGFSDQMQAILNMLPSKRQTMLFSATFAQQIEAISQRYLQNAEHVVLDQERSHTNIHQIAYILHDTKPHYAVAALLTQYQARSCIIFCSTKQATHALFEELLVKGFKVQCLHGDLSQYERDQVLYQFALSTVNVLVATDVAARGLDIPQVDLVINTELAESTETHTHRIGRTGRADKHGTAVTLIQSSQQSKLEQLAEQTKVSITAKHAQALRFHANRIEFPSHDCVMVDAGKRQKISKGDLLGALVKRADIVADDIGKMYVTHDKIFIAIKQRSVKRALAYFRENRVKGKKLRARKLK